MTGKRKIVKRIGNTSLDVEDKWIADVKLKKEVKTAPAGTPM